MSEVFNFIKILFSANKAIAFAWGIVLGNILKELSIDLYKHLVLPILLYIIGLTKGLFRGLFAILRQLVSNLRELHRFGIKHMKTNTSASSQNKDNWQGKGTE